MDESAVMDYGQLISAGDARRLACDCKLIPVVLGGDSEPRDVGPAMRTVPLGIRRASSPKTAGAVSRAATTARNLRRTPRAPLDR